MADKCRNKSMLHKKITTNMQYIQYKKIYNTHKHAKTSGV